MASISKISADELRLARKGGFKRKKPKKPNQSASLNTFENWIARYNQWCKDAKQKGAEFRKKQKLRDQIRNTRV